MTNGFRNVCTKFSLPWVLACMVFLLSGCGGVMAYRQMQIKNDEQTLMRLYTQCVQENYGDPQAIKELCKPIKPSISALKLGEFESSHVPQESQIVIKNET